MLVSFLPLTLLLFVFDHCHALNAHRHHVPSSLVKPRDDDSKLISGWYPGWRSTAFPVDKIAWSKYDLLTYSFGTTTPDSSKISLEESGGDYLTKFVSAAHEHNVKASLAIGGWSGSRYFSSAVGSPQNRTAFVKALTDLVDEYDLDGLDFDWEYPNNAGVGCNVNSPNDVPNFLSLLQELRQTSQGSSLTLSAAVFVAPWNDTSSNPPKPITNVTGFADVLDFIEIMNYDVFNLWAPVAGANAPLNDTCADHKRGSATSSVQLWTEAGFPASKIVLGLPFYARSFTVPKASALDSNGDIVAFPSYKPQDEQLGDELDGSGPDACGVNQPPTGVYTYQGLIDKKQLSSDGKPNTGIKYKWDECSQTPFLYNTTSQVYISYDNEDSLAKKGAFINDMGLKGFAAWDITGDHEDRLLNSIRSSIQSGASLGIKTNTSSKTSSDSSPTPSNDASMRWSSFSATLWIVVGVLLML